MSSSHPDDKTAGTETKSVGTKPNGSIIRNIPRSNIKIVEEFKHDNYGDYSKGHDIYRKLVTKLILYEESNHQELDKILKSKIGIEERITSSYLQDAKELIGNIENRPEIVIDIGGGAAKEFAPNLLRQLGCNVKVINENLSNRLKC